MKCYYCLLHYKVRKWSESVGDGPANSRPLLVMMSQRDTHTTHHTPHTHTHTHTHTNTQKRGGGRFRSQSQSRSSRVPPRADRDTSGSASMLLSSVVLVSVVPVSVVLVSVVLVSVVPVSVDPGSVVPASVVCCAVVLLFTAPCAPAGCRPRILAAGLTTTTRFTWVSDCRSLSPCLPVCLLGCCVVTTIVMLVTDH